MEGIIEPICANVSLRRALLGELLGSFIERPALLVRHTITRPATINPRMTKRPREKVRIYSCR